LGVIRIDIHLRSQLIALVINCSFDFAWSANFSFVGFSIDIDLYFVTGILRLKIHVILQMVLDIDSSLPNAGVKLLFFTRRCFYVWLIN